MYAPSDAYNSYMRAARRASRGLPANLNTKFYAKFDDYVLNTRHTRIYRRWFIIKRGFLVAELNFAVAVLRLFRVLYIHTHTHTTPLSAAPRTQKSPQLRCSAGLGIQAPPRQAGCDIPRLFCAPPFRLASRGLGDGALGRRLFASGLAGRLLFHAEQLSVRGLAPDGGGERAFERALTDRKRERRAVPPSLVFCFPGPRGGDAGTEAAENAGGDGDVGVLPLRRARKRVPVVGQRRLSDGRRLDAPAEREHWRQRKVEEPREPPVGRRVDAEQQRRRHQLVDRARAVPQRRRPRRCHRLPQVAPHLLHQFVPLEPRPPGGRRVSKRGCRRLELARRERRRRQSQVGKVGSAG
eukprot:scaffold35950_cov90-Isochrysis_galbana.AAC.3